MKIVNIVATAQLNDQINLKNLCDRLPNAKLSLKAGRWVKYRLQPENYYIAFYKSGKFLITGAKSVEEVHNIAHRVIRLINEKGIKIVLSKISLRF